MMMASKITQVWKYPLPKPDSGDIMRIEMPAGAEILTCQMQNDKPCIWVRVNPNAPKETRKLRIAGTGHEIEEENLRYISSFQMNNDVLIFHIFEVLEYKPDVPGQRKLSI